MARRPLCRYPALPQPRQLSAYDPEWEEDADYVERAQQTLREQAATQKLPRPAVLKDILTELTERQAQEQQQAEAEALAAAAGVPLVPMTPFEQANAAAVKAAEDAKAAFQAAAEP